MNNIECDELKKCIACFESINHQASICPHCRSPQQHRKLKFIGDAFKWIAGMTALLSLIIVITQVNTVYQSWHETDLFVEQLVNAAQTREKHGDIDSAYNMITEALEYKPTSYKARKIQLQLAMKKLRNISSFRTQKDHKEASLLLSILYKGLSISDKLESDLYAHIAWGNGLISNNINTGLKVDSYFNYALKIDKGNVFANAMLARWILEAHKRDKKSNWYHMPEGELVNKISMLFKTALSSGQEHQYVRGLQLSTYSIGDYNSFFAKEYIKTLIAMLKNNEHVSDYFGRDVELLFYRAYEKETDINDRSILTSILFSIPQDDLQIITRFLTTIDPDDKTRKIVFPSVFTARLAEKNREYEKALTIYNDVYNKLKNIDRNDNFLLYLPVSIQRVCNNSIAHKNTNKICNAIPNK